MNIDEIKTVADGLYYEANPSTKMCVPTYAYEEVERMQKMRDTEKSKLSLYDFCKAQRKTK